MLLLFLLLALLGGCGLVIGSALLTRLDPWQCLERIGDRVIIATWLGVLILANSFLIISLFTPLSPQVTVPATLLLLGFSLCSRQSRTVFWTLARQKAGIIVGIMALALGVAAYCSQVIIWGDSGLYHVQVIKWLAEFGLVPGLALIHSRFGFISSWFALSAPFNQGILQGRVATLPGALCLLLLLAHALVAFVRIAGQRAREQDLFIVTASLLALPVILLYLIPNSPSPDLPVIVLIIVTAWAMLTISDQESKHKQTDRNIQVMMIPLVLAVGAATIKLNALPLVMAAGLYYLFSGRPNFKKAATAGSLVALSLLPVAAAGLVTSGCAFYPVSFLCVDLPWSLGAAAAETEARDIRDWARWGGMLAPENATSWNWILPWLKTEKVCAALLILSLLAIISLLSSRTQATSTRFRQKGYVLALGIAGIAFMLSFAPTWRFGLGYLVVLPALAAADRASSSPAILKRLQGIKGLRNFGFIGIVVGTILALHVHVIQRPSYRRLDEAIDNRLVTLPPGEDRRHFNLLLSLRIWNINYEFDKATGEIEAFQNVIIKEQTADVIYCRPENTERSDACWDAPLPCSPGKLKNIKLRQPMAGFNRGFEKDIPASQRRPVQPLNF